MSVDEVLSRFKSMLDEGELRGRAWEQARQVVESVLQQDPGQIDALLLAGEMLLVGGGERGVGNFDQARQYFQQVREFEPSNMRANLGLGKIWVANRHWRQAIPYLERAERVATEETRGEVKRLLAQVYAATGNISGAIESAEQAYQADPDDLDVLQQLVQIRVQVATTDPRYLDGAISAAERYVQASTAAIEEDPADVERLRRLDRAYELQKQALGQYHNSLYERDPYNPNRRVDRLRRGKEAEAASVLLELAEQVRRHAALKAALAEHDAVTLVKRALEYQPDDIGLLEAYMQACQRIRDREGLIETCRRILKLDPDHDRARSQLEALGASLEADEEPSGPDDQSE